jgi:hypothetical protein
MDYSEPSYSQLDYSDSTHFHKVIADTVNATFDGLEMTLYYDRVAGKDKESLYSDDVYGRLHHATVDTVFDMDKALQDYMIQRFGGHFKMMKQYVNDTESTDVFVLTEQQMARVILTHTIEEFIYDKKDELLSYEKFKQWREINGTLDSCTESECESESESDNGDGFADCDDCGYSHNLADKCPTGNQCEKYIQWRKEQECECKEVCEC